MKKVVLGVIFSVGMFLPAAYSQGGCSGTTYSTDFGGATTDYCNNCDSGTVRLINPITGQEELIDQNKCIAGV